MLCSEEAGVEALVFGKGEWIVEGDVTLERLPSREARLGFAEVSYGLGRFFAAAAAAIISVFRLEGALESKLDVTSLSIPPTWDQSGWSKAVKLPTSSGALFAVEVL